MPAMLCHTTPTMLNLKPHLAARGMTQTALADELEITRGYMSLLVSGKREPSPGILARLADVLGVSVGDLFTETSTPGFQDGAARPYSPDARETSEIRAIAADTDRTRAIFKASRNAPAFGILTGDLLTVDLKIRPRPGDIVMATKALPDGTGETAIFRTMDPWLIAADATAQPIDLTKSAEIAIVGVVVSSVRRFRD